MLKSKRKVLFITLISLAVVAGIGAAILKYQRDTRIGWVDLPEIYKEFKYKKDMESRLITLHNTRRHILDSMEFELKVLTEELRSHKAVDQREQSFYKIKMEEYLSKKKEFEEEDYQNKEKYEEQILVHLNQYIREYGEKQGYVLLLGADGTGAVMYADKANNITEQVKLYVNEKYEGKN